MAQEPFVDHLVGKTLPMAVVALGTGNYAYVTSAANQARPYLPQNVAMIRQSGTDATIQVELWDATGKTLDIDGASSVTLTVGSTASSLHYLIEDQIGTDTFPTDAVGGQFRVLTHTVALNTGGSDDGSGTTGLAAAALAPTASNPEYYIPGDLVQFGVTR